MMNIVLSCVISESICNSQRCEKMQPRTKMAKTEIFGSQKNPGKIIGYVGE